MNDERQEGDVVACVPKDGLTAEEVRFGGQAHDSDAKLDSSGQPTGRPCEESDFFARLPAMEPLPLVPKEGPTAEEVLSGTPIYDPDAIRESSDQCVGMTLEKTDFSAGLLRAVEASLHESPHASGLINDQFASERSLGRRIFSSLTRLFIAALIGVSATLAWQYYGYEALKTMKTRAPSLGWLSSESTASRMPDTIHPLGDEEEEMVRIWALSLGWPQSISKMKSTPDFAVKQTEYTATGWAPAQYTALSQLAPVTQTIPAPAAAPSELAQQLEAVAHDLSELRHSVEQIATKQGQIAENMATLLVAEQDINQKLSPPILIAPVPIPPRKKIPRVTLQRSAERSSFVVGPPLLLH